MILWFVDRFGLPGQYHRIWVRLLRDNYIPIQEVQVVSLHKVMAPKQLLVKHGTRKAPTWNPDLGPEITARIDAIIAKLKPRAVVLTAPESLACIGVAPEHATLHNLRGSVYWRSGVPHLVMLPISAWHSLVSQKEIGAANYGFESQDAFVAGRAQEEKVVAEKFGRLTPLSPFGAKRSYRCDCGKTVEAFHANVTSGKTQSCGCYRQEVAERNLVWQDKHGKSNSRVYSIWEGMIQRCTNPNQENYRNYGGRGITVSDEWRDFQNFYRDMGDPPEGLTLERKDNDSGYSRENCVWATRSEQMQNTRRTQHGFENQETFTAARSSHGEIHQASGHDGARRLAEPVAGTANASGTVTRTGNVGQGRQGLAAQPSSIQVGPDQRHRLSAFAHLVGHGQVPDSHGEREGDASADGLRDGDVSGSGDWGSGDSADAEERELAAGAIPDDPADDSGESGEAGSGDDDDSGVDNDDDGVSSSDVGSDGGEDPDSVTDPEDAEMDQFFYEPVLSPVGRFVLTADTQKLFRILRDGKHAAGPARPIEVEWRK